MNYKFPEINHISEVLPHVEGRTEFIVAERDFGFVVNYVVTKPDTFDMEGPDDLGGAIRRECRGIMFDRDGNIMSRPFHKFFNVNEREETRMNNVDMDRGHVVMEKMDGSMIRPILLDGELRLATKMGLSDVALEAEKWFWEQERARERAEWLLEMMEAGITPLFEFIAPTNRIVIRYDEADLVYLGSRETVSGDYFFDYVEEAMPPFTFVPTYGSLEGNLEEYISRARQMEGREGDIIRFADGHMMKMKNDWYVLIHKTKDKISTERYIAEIIINEELDDVIPLLDEQDLATVRAYEAKFSNGLENALGRLEGLVLLARTLYSGDKKEVAINFVPNFIHKEDASFVFRALDGKELRPLVIEHIKKSVGNTARYEALEKWMEF